MARARGLSVRLKLALSYAGFLMLAGFLLLAAVWVFLLRGLSFRYLIPSPSDWLRVFDFSNRGPIVFGPAAVLIMGFLLIFGLAGGWLLAGRMLAPLNRLTDATRLAANGSLSHRIRLSGREDEFRELADSFDAMLAKLEAQVAEQRRFAANASHELRTPLATTRALLDVARADPGFEAAKLVEQLSAVNARAIGLTEALLLLSRSDQGAFTPEPVDLSLLVEEAVETLLSLAETRGVGLDISGDIARVAGSRALLLQMVINLLHNAIVHNRPEGGTIGVSTRLEGQTVTLSVENTGETLPQDLVSTLTEPFQRGAERTRSDHSGVGLGLAIVKSIVQAHGGSLVLKPRPGGGLHVAVQFPAMEALG